MKWSTPEVKKLNKELVRKAVKELGECTKSDVAKETSLSVATCNTLLNEMLEAGEILKQDQEVAKMGRPADRFIYNKDYHHVMSLCVLAVDSIQQIDWAVADAMGEVIDQGSKQIVSPTQLSVDEVIQEVMAKDDKIASISIGIPGVTNKGVVERCDIKSLIGADLQNDFAKKYGVNVELRNDMDFVAYGAYNYRFQGTGNMAVASFPEHNSGYVGCGFVIGGRVLTGFSKFSGELSYITEGFGVSRARMKEKCKEHDELVNYMSQIALVIETTIDPECLIIMSNEIDEDDITTIRNKLTDILGSDHVPQIGLEKNILEDYTCGMIVSAINRLDFPLTCPI